MGTACKRDADEAKERTDDERRAWAGARLARATRDCMAVVVDGRAATSARSRVTVSGGARARSAARFHVRRPANHQLPFSVEAVEAP